MNPSKQQSLFKYEILLIAHPKLKNADPLIEKINNFFSKETKTSVKKMGLKALGTPIAKETSGFYVLFIVQTQAKEIEIAKPKIQRLREVLRFLIINLDQEKSFQFKNTLKKDRTPASPKSQIENNS